MSGGGGELSGAGARAVVLVRHRSTLAGRPEPEVHLVPLPLRGTGPRRDTVGALCGRQLHTERIVTVTPGESCWCTYCFVSHVTGSPPPTTPARDPDATGAIAERLSVGVAYQRLGWPVTVGRHEVTLNLALDVDAVALVIPAVLATEVADILTRRRCLPPVLAHPAMPTHRVIVAGDPYPVPLAWPDGVHRVTGTLLLPPTVTDRGSLHWLRPPVPHALKLCREVDVLAALRTALTDPPTPDCPAGPATG